MAEKEVDLDDFFAKRDKKKKTGKKKYETTEELAKILGKRTEERKKLEEGKSQYVVEGEGAAPGTTQEDDEWLEQKDDTVDLTGLKVTELVLGDESDEEVGGEGKEVDAEGGSTTDGPWRKRAAAAAAAAATPAPAPAPIPESATLSREDGDDSKEETSTGSEVFEENGTAAATGEEGQGQSGDVEGAATTPATDGPVKYIPPSMRKAMEAAAVAGAAHPGRPPMPTPIDIFAVRPLSEPTPGGGGGGGEGVKGAYVPPGRRSGAAGPTSKPRKSAAAPNINEENFPSLGMS